MDGFKSCVGDAIFLGIFLVEENARMAREDWLKAVVTKAANLGYNRSGYPSQAYSGL
jgi:hypothetical protein